MATLSLMFETFWVRSEDSLKTECAASCATEFEVAALRRRYVTVRTTQYLFGNRVHPTALGEGKVILGIHLI